MLTPPNSSYGGAGANNPPPFPSVADGTGDAAHAEAALGPLPNATVVNERLSGALVAEAVARLARPCRVLVSGPGGFNAAATAMLADLVEENEITVLSA